MQHKKFVACAAAAVMAVALGCSNDSPSPVSPTGAAAGGNGAGPAGETLKATAPTPQSPINNQQPDSLVLVAGKSSPTYPVGTAPTYTYEFEIRNSAGTATLCPRHVVPGGSGSSVSGSPTCTLEFDATVHLARPRGFCWRLRAVVGECDVPRSSRRLHPRQRDHGPADQRQDGGLDLRPDAVHSRTRASRCSITRAS